MARVKRGVIAGARHKKILKKAKGYYKAAGLDVNLKVGGPTIVNEQTLTDVVVTFTGAPDTLAHAM